MLVTNLLLLVDFGPMASSLVVLVCVSQRDAHVPWDQLAAGKAVPEKNNVKFFVDPWSLSS